MENCINHPDRESYSVCHNCVKPNCQDCLTEGGEYYFCENPDCLLAKQNGINSKLSAVRR
jgi:hypothetical protein